MLLLELVLDEDGIENAHPVWTLLCRRAHGDHSDMLHLMWLWVKALMTYTALQTFRHLTSSPRRITTELSAPFQKLSSTSLFQMTIKFKDAVREK